MVGVPSWKMLTSAALTLLTLDKSFLPELFLALQAVLPKVQVRIISHWSIVTTENTPELN